MTVFLQLIGVALIAAGALLTFVTSLGMVRLGSLFSRMHASTKPQVLSLVIMSLGLAFVMQQTRVAATLVLVVVMQFVVAPISAHMLGRAVFRLGQVTRDTIVLDEYTEDIERAVRQLEESEGSVQSEGGPVPPAI
ncbi:MAG: monovalent cation/H(+) antiporter subunit G [Brooklawnia sp.]